MSKSTLRSIKDPNTVAGFKYKRVPRNWQERLLKWLGWEPAGIALLTHPRYGRHASPCSLDVAWNKQMEHFGNMNPWKSAKN